MSTVPGTETREMILPPGTYCYVQAINTGKVTTRTGPTAFTLTQQDQLVGYDQSTDSFSKVDQTRAIRQNAKASEGDYLVLENPAQNSESPKEGSNSDSQPPLQHGRRINIPGPINFALWPGQRTSLIRGHQLRLNQYLIVRVYNSELAIENWAKGFVAVTKNLDPSKTDPKAEAAKAEAAKLADAAKADATKKSILNTNPSELNLSNGSVLIIKGTDVSFYIPPTGVEVVPDNEDGTKTYVRNAVTLERLEYCILVDENGNKRYAQGPAVIFPEPTERFMEDNNEAGEKTRKFKAIELNSIQGIHVKVIAPYEDDDGVNHEIGEELFLTGANSAIYYPRPEHSIIRYGNQMKHFATAVPAGEGRYVMNRKSGEIKTSAGPAMLLPNPIDEVIVRRILSTKEVTLWYPRNQEALAYNQQLAAATSVAGTSNSNFVDDTAYRSRGMSTPSESMAFAAMPMAAMAPAESASSRVASDAFNRGTNYNKPRTLTLDGKFDGVPQISIWTGYAVMVVNKRGGRRVVQGPANVLLDYDETLERFALSTGKPKVTDRLHEDVYLGVLNNKVSDIVEVETSDHVRCSIKISLVVNFEGAPEKWFSVDNYVKLLCDHVRSVLKGAVQQIKIENFYNNSVATVRDIVLGKIGENKAARPGMSFSENGMIVRDVEVLEVILPDSNIAQMLKNAQQDVIKTNLEITTAQRTLESTKTREDIARKLKTAQHETTLHSHALELQRIEEKLQAELADIDAEIKIQAQKLKEAEAKDLIEDAQHNNKLARELAEANQEAEIEKETQNRKLELMNAEAESVIKRMASISPGLTEALIVLGREKTLVDIAQATSIQSMLGGNSAVDALTRVLNNTPLGSKLATVLSSVNKTDSAHVNTR